MPLKWLPCASTSVYSNGSWHRLATSQ